MMTKCTDPNCKCYTKDTKVEKEQPKEEPKVESKIYGGQGAMSGITVEPGQKGILESFGVDTAQIDKAIESFGHWVVDSKPGIIEREFSWSRAFGEWLDSEEFKKLEFGKGLSTPNYWFQLSNVLFETYEKTNEAMDSFIDEKLEKLGPLGDLLKHMGEHTHENGKKHSSIFKAFHNGEEIPPEEALADLIGSFADILKKNHGHKHTHEE